MFTEEKISMIFGNIEEIFKFSTQFLETLESAYCKEQPHQSELGKCFLKHVSGNILANKILAIHSKCSNLNNRCWPLKNMIMWRKTVEDHTQRKDT